ncbi:EAL domain-containing protein [Pseudomonas sp. 31-12]|uniref:EAL domain-containing protein n=1 Tax=Pseudomonas sp. 31-12 TaxID=2201356 RepID=UPI0021157C3F|nr:EAL domain-containing protein [Pseudomonas sp. 31-12]
MPARDQTARSRRNAVVRKGDVFITTIDAIYRATNSIDLPLIAEMVETKGELEVIRELGLFGVMGRLIGPPKPM